MLYYCICQKYSFSHQIFFTFFNCTKRISNMISAGRIRVLVFSSPEQKAPRWANSIYQWLLRRSSVNIFKHFHLETTGPIELKFHMENLRMRNESLFKWSWSHDQDGRPYMVKNPKNFLLQNQKADDLGTWYESLGMWGLPSLFK